MLSNQSNTSEQETYFTIFSTTKINTWQYQSERTKIDSIVECKNIRFDSIRFKERERDVLLGFVGVIGLITRSC